MRPISRRCGGRSRPASRGFRSLRAVFELYGMPYPGYRFVCTCRAARRVFGRSLPDHRLHTVSAACGFDLAHHHHALADAEACARIALKIL